ncbi:MAG: OmpA family protein [Candidatus Aenigmarchaeota archaeon]|nr:OmpA family protein [Candidatus Aenigmarchaeota archaeon]
MTTASAARHIRFVAVIVVLAGLGLGLWSAYRHFFQKPRSSRELLDQTASPSRYKDIIATGGDSFSGYAPLRLTLETELGRLGIKNTWVDDSADYRERMRRLRDGEIQFAVFDVSSFILWSAAAGELPGTIILILDESRGADAVVAWKDSFPSLSSLNTPEVRIILTPGSPSDTLFRTVLTDLNFSLLRAEWWDHVDGSEEAYQRFLAGKGKKEAYVLWEPYVSQALSQPGATSLIDSSQVRGVIVDILVVGRDYLVSHHDVVKQVVEAYLRTLYSLQDPERMLSVLQEDAKKHGQHLTRDQAASLVSKIQWKNTLENYAHFGIQSVPGMMHLEDICTNLVRILQATGSLDHDPTDGRPVLLFHDGILQELHQEGFHPGQRLGVVGVTGPGTEAVRTDLTLQALSEAEWEKILPVAELRVPPITFRRGSADLTPEADHALRSLARVLETYPHYYLDIKGNARKGGDPEANRRLAQSRAESVRDLLVNTLGVSPARIRASAAEPTQQGAEAQSVTFLVGQKAY